jgi:phosphopantothenoylcysteine decarboxylase/phosphopantothenate--cysteine ligase
MDPVRYLSNPSSGKMGYALAEAASRRGATVTLVSGPTSLAAPPGVTRVDVTSAREMYDEVIARSTADIVVMAAAVSDYAPAQAASQKLKKTDAELVLRLSRTPDILTELGRRKSESQILIGFAMETEKHEENARRKLKSKNLDWIVLNKLNEEGSGFETDTNRVTLIHRSGEQEDLPLMSKRSVAEAILNRIAAPPRSAA